MQGMSVLVNFRGVISNPSGYGRLARVVAWERTTDCYTTVSSPEVD